MKRFCSGLALVGFCAMMTCAHADTLPEPVVVGIADMCMATNSVSVLTTYVDAFARAGNTPLVLPAETNRAVVARMLASVDVLLLCGGEDVEPRRYKAKPSPRLGEVNLRRDGWEFLLLDEAVKRSLPVIGICRGCQLINVYFGGTLWQDLPSERPGNVVHRGKDVVHDIQIVAGSRLAGRLGTGRLNVNSRHHQAVRDLAPGFRAVAFAPDGVVEAIEGDALPVVGVQFHPEKLFVLKDRDEFRVLFADPLGWAKAGLPLPHARKDVGGRMSGVNRLSDRKQSATKVKAMKETKR